MSHKHFLSDGDQPIRPDLSIRHEQTSPNIEKRDIEKRAIQVGDTVKLTITRTGDESSSSNVSVQYYDIFGIIRLDHFTKIQLSERGSDHPDDTKYIVVLEDGTSTVISTNQVPDSTINYVVEYLPNTQPILPPRLNSTKQPSTSLSNQPNIARKTPVMATDDFPILEHYTIIREIAKGGFGAVYEVEVKDDFSNGKYQFKKGQRLAMKESKHGGIGEITEIDILNRINHPNVVNAFDTFETYNEQGNCEFIRIILPLARYDFHDYLERWNGQLNQTQMITMLYHILCGLNYLHLNHIVHDDLKPQNILIYAVTDTGRIPKITDFGMSNILVMNKGVNRVSHTIWWRAPEILAAELAGKPHYHRYETDMWALGVIFIEAFLNYSPFATDDSSKEESGILNVPLQFGPGSPRPVQSTDPLIPTRMMMTPYNIEKFTLGLINKFLSRGEWKKSPKLTPPLVDLISRLLDPNPLTRINSSEALVHPVFNGRTCEVYPIEPTPWNMTSPVNPKARQIITGWMKEVSDEYTMPKPTIFLAIDIYDRYLAISSRNNTKCFTDQKTYQLVAVVALCLASHITMAPEHIPEISDFIWVSGHQYTEHAMTNMICMVLKCLDWVVYRPTLNVLYPDIDVDELEQCYIRQISPQRLTECES